MRINAPDENGTKWGPKSFRAIGYVAQDDADSCATQPQKLLITASSSRRVLIQDQGRPLATQLFA